MRPLQWPTVVSAADAALFLLWLPKQRGVGDTGVLWWLIGVLRTPGSGGSASGHISLGSMYPVMNKSTSCGRLCQCWPTVVSAADAALLLLWLLVILYVGMVCVYLWL